MKPFYFLALFGLMAAPAWATHLLGGQIQARNTSGNTYEITVVLYMDEAAGRISSDQMSQISVCMGDGNLRTIPRTTRTAIFDKTLSVNIWRFTHSYPGPGVYEVTCSITGRSKMANITVSEETNLTLRTTLQVRGGSLNTTPAFSLTEEFLNIGINQRAALNFRVTDPDGDSLTYALVRPFTTQLAANCNPVALAQYQYPNAVSQRGTYRLNARTGELVWDAPVASGQYVATIQIREWRNGIQISESQVETILRVLDKAGTSSTIPPFEPAAEVVSGGLVLGTESDTETDLLLTVSPNPVQEQLTVQVRSQKSAPLRLQLLDLTGRVMDEKNFTQPRTDQKTVFSVGSLPSGVYLIRADFGGRVLSRKALKQ
jgi:Secretion system C-terminal sorting domain